jgi:hypothetical protein
MAGTEAPVGLPITVTGGDRATAELAKISRGVQNLDKSFGSLAGRIKSGLQWHLVYNGIRMIERAIYSVVTAIPNLIGRGQEWARVVDDISDATGMTAQQSSELAAVQLMLGGSTESLSKAMVQLSRNARMHENVLKEMGVATRNSRGEFLGIYQILQNLRNAYAATGDRATAFGRAYQQLGRGTREVTDLLALNAGQYAALAAQAQRAGLIMNESMARNAEALRRTQGILDATITGLGNQILGGVAPVLTALVNGISQVIQDNMGNIVRFAVWTVNTIAGIIGGLFGLNFQLITLSGQMDNLGKSSTKAGAGLGKFGDGSKKAASGASAAEKAIQRQIDAIDRQLKLLDRQEKREDAKAEHAKLMQDIREAKSELADIRSQSIFDAGLSEAEAELARQAQAAQVNEGIKGVKDAEERLQKWRRDQAREHQRQMLQDRRDALQKELSAMKSAGAAMAGAASLAGIKMGKGLVDGFKPLTAEMKRQQADLMALGRDALANGQAIAASIKDLLFGPAEGAGVNTSSIFGGLGPSHEGNRSGGLAGFVNQIATLGGFLVKNTDALLVVGGAIAGWKIASTAVAIAAAIRSALGLGGAAAGAATGGSGLLGTIAKSASPFAIAAAINSIMRKPGPMEAGEYSGQTGLPQFQSGWDIGMNVGTMGFNRLKSGVVSTMKSYLASIFNGKPGTRRGLGGGNKSGGDFGGFTPDWNLINNVMPGFGASGQQGMSLFASTLERVNRGYWGEGSTAILALQNIDSSIASLAAAITGTDDGGGTGPPPPNPGKTLAQRVGDLEDEMNAAQKGIRGVRNVNKSQGRAILQRVEIDDYNKGYRRNATQHKAFGQMLDNHERRLDRLDGGGGTNPDRRGPGGGQTIVIQLDRKGTRDLLGGRAVTTTTRAVAGV